MSAMSAAEYDALIYPGFLRRNVARWNDDGSAAPLSRSKGPRNETFVLQLRSGEIDQDVSAIEGELGLALKGLKGARKGRASVNAE
ncbi:predicted protein [Ostreococcus lucimarinus CCE9901]|uniref:Uncharacterized protein n=1 Tax=Ostreococcus lucimarinus (strain CCE9901) TaxID=436017 RepID=A4RSH0_OSTLU|nr:predicted protein [Ostreococcus lucimarinus CCE9901]ABO94543.1 predicted protein [Ostreococcus lucimarinus CCE9901]|eukprot:XP_001416250.1 predicted protein [Ostreococcus lucimarinus CCE9901]